MLYLGIHRHAGNLIGSLRNDSGATCVGFIARRN
jgi:hypothetical protein